jgi:antitoxin VapB
MNQQLNIKNAEARALADALATLTGESLTEAVTVALRERLEREQRARAREARIARLLELGREIRAHMREPVSSADHGALYDPETGLPA